MFENMTPAHRAALDAIIGARHTVREFRAILLGRADVEAIIQAGLLAPFPALAVAGRPDFRKVVVIPNPSPAMKTATDVIRKRMAKLADELEQKLGLIPYVNVLKRAREQEGPIVGDAPYFVIVGERKGMPPAASESLSYCLENMWLKATSLKIGFRLISATMQMGGDPDFCALLGIPCGEYALDGCALGYPAEGYEPAPVEYPMLARSVTWL
ncbi:MAG TPA: nitroreductase family protein [bacterium]|nr:nitroreductase family protein [bacterium]